MDLATRFTFLGYPRLSDSALRETGEFPPHPDRVLQAMVSAGAETGQDFSVLSSLESSPAIQAGEFTSWKAPKKYVPENFKRGKVYHTGTLKQTPHIIPKSSDDFSVAYIWKNVPENLIDPISEIVKQVTHIGRACSFVRGEVVPVNSIKPNYFPDKQGSLYMRVPYSGRVEDLRVAYQQSLRCPKKYFVRYKKQSAPPFLTEWGELFVLRPSGNIDAHESAKWTDLFRRTAFSVSEDNMSGFIHGHDTHRHIAWASMPDVGHPYAKGNILGLGCWTPRDMTDNERISVVDILCKIKEARIKGVSFDFDLQKLSGLQLKTWAEPSQRWASVTPVALPQWPKKGKKTIEEIFIKHLKQRGLPFPVKFKTFESSRIKGSPNFLKKYGCHGSPKFLCHAQIEWEVPIQGPLLLGADRYFGGGLFRPI